MLRIRIHYAKKGALRYTGNLDMQKIWERLFRRAGIPLAYSQGFHPQPRLNQACPLPLGMTSKAELIDAWLEQESPADDFLLRLQNSAPPGMEILTVEPVDLRQDALPLQVKSAIYHAKFKDAVDFVKLQNAVFTFLNAGACLRERRGKTYDLQPLVEDLSAREQANGECYLAMQLSARESATGRPDEVLLALGFDPTEAKIERIELAIS